MKNLWKNHSYTIMFLFSIFVFSLLSLHNSEEKYKSTTVTVSEGDTLWTIAERFETDKLPQDKLIGWIEEHNDINNGEIRAGDKIIVPSTISGDSGSLAGEF